jgi:hypothetical protein
MPPNGELEQIRIHIARLLVVIAKLPLLWDGGERRGIAGIDAGHSSADEDAAQELLRVINHVISLSSDPIRVAFDRGGNIHAQPLHCYSRPMQTAARAVPQGASPMWIGIAIILLLLWAGGFFAFHVAGFLIHILLILAVVSFVIHFITGRRAAA